MEAMMAIKIIIEMVGNMLMDICLHIKLPKCFKKG